MKRVFNERVSHLVRRGETDRTDDFIEPHPLPQLQQGDVVVVVVGLEVWMEEDLLHRAVGGKAFVSDIMETKEDLEDKELQSGTCGSGSSW